MIVEVEDVQLLGTCMQVSELHEVTDIGVVNVGRIVRILCIACADGCVALAERVAGMRRAEFEARIRRDVDQHGRVADSERAEEEFLIRTAQAVMHRANAETVGDDLRTDAA